MPLTKLQFRPGINRDTTSYANEGGWFDSDKVRFRDGVPEKIGGWERKGVQSFLGTCRALHPFTAIDGSAYIGVGTHLKYYVEIGSAYNDITPLSSTTAAGSVTFSATDGSSEITVNNTAHSASVGDFVTIYDADGLGGNITADVLNQEYVVKDVSTNYFIIEAREVATLQSITVNGIYTPTLVTANSSDTGSGGTSAYVAYQIPVGIDTAVAGNGWSAGTYGRNGWGSSTSLAAVGDRLRLWSHDNFGEDLIINVRDSGIYYWDKSANAPLNPYGRAVALQNLAGADGYAPTIAKKVIVSDIDRHIIAFGCDPESQLGVQDPLLIRFSDQENPLVWQTLETNTAGELRLGSGSEIVTAVETRQQILIFTDKSLHTMQYLGPPLTFGLQMVSENVNIVSPESAIAVEDAVYWMGLEEFYVYTGRVQELPCTVRSYVFEDFNFSQAEKITAGINSSFSEIWWFYPSANSQNIDRYVVFNYRENSWYYGTLDRTAWLDRGASQFPIAASLDHYLYFHETGNDDGSQNPATAISSFIESSPIDIGEGEQFMFLSKVIPDVTFVGSTGDTPSVDFVVKTRNFPGAAYANSDTNAVTRSASTPVEQFTNQFRIRLRGRSMALRIASDETGVNWRLGAPRIDMKPDGRR